MHSRHSMLSSLLHVPITTTPNLYTLVYHRRHGLCHLHGCASPFPRLNCTHEEPDDGMMFHVLDILSHRSGPTFMTLSLGDINVFVCLLYLIRISWKDPGLKELWFIRNSKMRRSNLPLQDKCGALGDKLARCFPALHALTGCDTTPKIFSKLAALKAIHKNLFLIHNFNS